MADKKKSWKEAKAEKRAVVNSIEAQYAEHLLTEHGVTAVGTDADTFHARYYRQCPYVPPPLR